MAARIYVALVLRLKIKFMGESSLIFTGLWFDIYLRMPSEKIQVCVMEEERV
jgi:hypothetical protein